MNSSAGNKEQIDAVFKNNIIPPLLQLLADDEFAIRKEAAYAISNMISFGNSDQIKFLIQQGCIRPLCDLLKVLDPKIITIALESLETILKIGVEDMRMTCATYNEMAVLISEHEGLDRIEVLQMHPMTEIYNRCISILETYYGIEEESECVI